MLSVFGTPGKLLNRRGHVYAIPALSRCFQEQDSPPSDLLPLGRLARRSKHRMPRLPICVEPALLLHQALDRHMNEVIVI